MPDVPLDTMVLAAETLARRAQALAAAPETRAPLIVLLTGAALLVWLAMALAIQAPLRRRARRAEAATEACAAALARAEAAAERIPSLEAALEAERRGASEARAAAAALSSRLEVERREAERRLADLRRMEEAAQRTFDALAHKALDGAQSRFLDLAAERFRAQRASAEADLAARQTAIENLVKPVGETLARFETRVGDIEKAREGAYAAVAEQVRALGESQSRLRDETARLVQALRAPKTRGNWGELQLRRVFEVAGMTEHVDYSTEVSTETSEGLRRPDAVIRLPGGRALVVDAKTPLDAYLAALEASDDAAREAALTRHARQFRERVRELSSKAYWSLFDDAPDFVVMFVPGEAFWSVAMERDPRLFEDAIEARVVVASPTTLVALAKSVAYGWRQEALAQDAREIATAARDLYDRLGVFGEHFAKVGRAIEHAARSYNGAVGSMEGRVLPTLRRFEALKVKPAGAEAAKPSLLEVEPRPPSEWGRKRALSAAE